MLLGSNIQPSVLKIGGREVQLGELVGRAFSISGLDVDSWNGLPDMAREQMIQIQREQWEFEAKMDRMIIAELLHSEEKE